MFGGIGRPEDLRTQARIGQIAVIGAGYVGLVTAACFAELGNRVCCADIDPAKVEALLNGHVPFYEPGLAEIVARNLNNGRLRFTTLPSEAIAVSDVVFVAVGTPTGEGGHADLRFVERAAADIARALNGPKIIVNKSTVPVETGDLVDELIKENSRGEYECCVVSNPEFLREGSAVADFMRPDRIVIGTSSKTAADAICELYAPLNAPIIITDVRTAEMIKYTANAFLATKVSFINEIARLCERVGADIIDVVRGAGSDARIGSSFMNPGLGFGGSCFPKDVLALSRIAEKYGLGPNILRAVLDVNRTQIAWIANRIDAAVGLRKRQVALLGLAFKPNTDDVRESPAIALAREFLRRGARVVAHDPEAVRNARRELGDSITYASNPYEAAQAADCVVLATEWNEYKQLDLGRLKSMMTGKILFDARNIYNAKKVRDLGFDYLAVGSDGATAGHLLTSESENRSLASR